VIIKEELYDKEFVAKRTKDFESFKEKILNDEYANPEFFEKIEGYEYLSKVIPNIAREYALKRSMILWGLGVTQHLDGFACCYGTNSPCNDDRKYWKEWGRAYASSWAK